MNFLTNQNKARINYLYLLICSVCILCSSCKNTSSFDRNVLETSSQKYYHCYYIPLGSIVIDGYTSDPHWDSALSINNFKTAGNNPVDASYKTTAKFLWDDNSLYAVFQCFNETIKTAGTNRDDEIWNGESVELFLCPEGANNPYFEIDVNPSNVIYDSHIYSWKWENLSQHWKQWALSYTASVRSATSISTSADKKIISWCMEIAIPFSSLGRHSPFKNEQWLFNAARSAVKTNNEIEFSSWEPTYGDFHRPFTFPRFIFVKK